MVLCKTFEAIIGGSGCVVFLFFYFVKWKSNVVLGLCGCEDFEKKKEG
jgi:hypothetical protein